MRERAWDARARAAEAKRVADEAKAEAKRVREAKAAAREPCPACGLRTHASRPAPSATATSARIAASIAADIGEPSMPCNMHF